MEVSRGGREGGKKRECGSERVAGGREGLYAPGFDTALSCLQRHSALTQTL